MHIRPTTCALMMALMLGNNGALGQQTLQALQAQAEEALTSGEPNQTVALAQTILADDPGNYAALFLTALAQSDLGDFTQAAQTARQAYQSARTPNDKLQSARLAASTRFRLGQYTRAEWWLRRAANNTQTDEDVANVRREFQNIRQANPLSIQANISIAPSDNINNGSEDESFQLEGLPFDFLLPPEQQALSGIEYAADAQLSYRISQNARQVTTANVYVYGRTFTLSSDAQDSVPGISGDDYALSLIDVSLAQRRILFRGVGPSSASINIGRSRFSGEPLWDYWKVTLGQQFITQQNGVFRLSGSFQDQTARRATQFDTKITEVIGGYRHALGNQDALDLSLTARQNDTGDEESSFEEYQANIGYGIAEPVFGINWAFSLGIGHVNYDEFSLSLDGRQDNYVTLKGTATFSDISYFGFSPTFSMTARRTESDVSQFTSSQVQARFGIQSNF